jgi:Domain of unknown function (DUF3597)
MSIFGSIASAIFGSAAHAEGAAPAAPSPAAKADAPAAPAQGESAAMPAKPTTMAANDKGTPPAAAPTAASPNIIAKTPVDVMAVLDKLDDATDEKLEWSTSIVDLMKLLGLDSSLAARKQLAKELGYPGDSADSAKMNVWLHKAVMVKLGENGGIVPEHFH